MMEDMDQNELWKKKKIRKLIKDKEYIYIYNYHYKNHQLISEYELHQVDELHHDSILNNKKKYINI